MNVSFFRERRPSRSEDEDKTQRSTSKLLTIRSELVRKILCDVIEDQLQTNVFQIGIQSEFRKRSSLASFSLEKKIIGKNPEKFFYLEKKSKKKLFFW